MPFPEYTLIMKIALVGLAQEDVPDNIEEIYDESLHDFERFLHDNDIDHTLCKVGHPQSNGKIERFFQTYEKHRQRFGTLDEFLTFYNEERPHMSLD